MGLHICIDMKGELEEPFITRDKICGTAFDRSLDEWVIFRIATSHDLMFDCGDVGQAVQQSDEVFNIVAIVAKLQELIHDFINDRMAYHYVENPIPPAIPDETCCRRGIWG